MPDSQFDQQIQDQADASEAYREELLSGPPGMKIKTVHIRPPIPVRYFDWCAFDENGGEEEGPYGWGKSEREAILDFRQEVGEQHFMQCQKCGKFLSEHAQSNGYRCPGTTGDIAANNWTPPNYKPPTNSMAQMVSKG